MMNKKAYIYVNYSNFVVLNVYLDVIKQALSGLNYECTYINNLHGIPKHELIVFPMGKDAYKYYHKGYRNFLLWQQGATGEESFMRHSSNIRKGILNYLDCFAMKKAKMIFFVSEYMRDYYSSLAHTSFADKSYIMPCFNDAPDWEIITKKTYDNKIFAYVGSLAPWQCFQETVALFAEIERRIPDAFFKVLTFDTEKAHQILTAHNVRNFSVARVPKEQVKKELENATYGFMIRQDSIVNRVATPTKISSYLSAGVLPIYSPCLRDFHAQATGKMFAQAFSPDESMEHLIQYVNTPINKHTILQEIRVLFNVYYCPEYHIQNIIALAKKCLNS